MLQKVKQRGLQICHGFGVDFGRLWSTSSFRMAAILNIVVLPATVAFALVVIFVSRGFPQDTVSSFIFFSTLYLFWSGLFIACRSVNGAVESGEWTYWVLGIRRAIGSYVWALVLYRILQVLCVCLVFTAVVWGTTLYWRGYWTIAVTGPYLMPASTGGESFEVYDTVVALFTDGALGTRLNLSHTLSAFAKWSFLRYFFLGMLAAGISGVLFGLLFSVFFKRSLQSVSFSVGFIMLITILSFVSMRPSRVVVKEPNSTDAHPSTEVHFQSPCFLPVFYEWKLGFARCLPVSYKEPRNTSTLGGTERGRCLAKWMQAMSHLFPQRYFFNIAHATVPRLGYLSRGDIEKSKWGCVERGNVRTWNNKILYEEYATCRRRAHGLPCWCVFCLRLAPREWHERASVQESVDDEAKHWGSFWLMPGEFDQDNVDAKNRFRSSLDWDRSILTGIWSKVVLWEGAALSVLLTAYGLILWLFLRRPWLRQLR